MLPPEPVSVRRRRFLVGYAIAVWVYRFVLFLTIALIVYHFFFKALGIVLMVVEIGYFIVRPVVLELRAWATERRAFRWNAATFRTLLLLAGLVAAMAVPWQSRVEVPAVWQAHQQAVLYAPLPARVAELQAQVQADAIAATLRAQGETVYALGAIENRAEGGAQTIVD